jgi:hypothetical protein
MRPKAPIAFFAYKRPNHTQRALESLRRNESADQSELFVFCEGPKRPEEQEAVQQVRDLVRSKQWCGKVHITEQACNYGLADSIISGVTDICQRYGRVIVLEDDLVLSPYFLSYMNQALESYQENNQVMQVSGYMFPIELSVAEESTFLPVASSWGWATWQRAWEHFDPHMSGYTQLKASKALRDQFDLNGSYYYFSMLEGQKDGKTDSWAIRWYLSVFMQAGLVLYPTQSLVSNIGCDGSGTHYNKKNSNSSSRNGNLSTKKIAVLPKSAKVDEAVINAVSTYLRSNYEKQMSLPRRLIHWSKAAMDVTLKNSRWF